MATQIDDPITDTTWFDSGDLPGSIMTMVVAAVGIGFLLTVLNIGQATVQPILSGVFGNVPGVQTSEDAGLIVED